MNSRRALALLGGLLVLVLGLTVLSGGRPVLLALPGLVFAAAVLVAPLLGLVLTIVTHIIWLLGAYAPGGICPRCSPA